MGRTPVAALLEYFFSRIPGFVLCILDTYLSAYVFRSLRSCEFQDWFGSNEEEYYG